MIIFAFILFFPISILSVSPAKAQNKSATAVRINGHIDVDGKLDDEFWANAKPSDGFLQRDPVEGANVSEPTELYFLYNETHLFVGARMFRSNPEKIRAYVSRRDNMGNSERIIISFDTYCKQTSSYSFAITATGVRADYYHGSDDENDRDYNYNPVWEGKANIDSLGWTAEMAIPFSQLRFNDADELVFGINSNIYSPSNKEDAYWVLIPKIATGWSSKFGKLYGIKGIKHSTRLELLPYISSGLDINSKNDADDPFFKKQDAKFNAGIDVKMGLGPNATLDASINPDFGQVEADPAELNLSEFETYYQEKRLFFIEGNSLFQNDKVQYYYSRRIGSPPANMNHNYHQEHSHSSTILAAGKLTGRNDANLSFGAMTSLVDQQKATFIDRDNNNKSKRIVFPLSFYNIARFNQEFGDEGSNIGALITAVNRNNNSELTNAYYNEAAYSGGIDFEYFWNDKMFQITANLGFSHIEGTKERLLAVQRQTTQLFQRPDAKHLSIDSNANSLTGYVGQLGIKRASGKHWLWTLEYYTESPGLNFNDFGIIQHSDEHKFWGLLKYRENKPNSIFHSYSVSLFSHYRMNYAREQLDLPLKLSGNFTFLSENAFDFEIGYYAKSWSDTKTRGGMMMAIPPLASFNIGFNSDWSQPFQWNVNIYFENDNYGKESISYYSHLEYKLMRWKLSVGINYDDSDNPQQYVGTYSRNTSETYGKRYVFGFLSKKELSSSIRINYSFTPDLTFEFYANPFISSGKYQSFSELTGRNDLKMREYGKVQGTSITLDDATNSYKIKDGTQEFEIYNQDFLYKSFRASSVLRWEYLPGCIFFAVWQINNNDYREYYQRINTDNYFDAITSPGINSFMLKFSYWLSAS